MLKSPAKKLQVVVDVSCDATNPHNPLPIYEDGESTFDVPAIPVLVDDKPVGVEVVAIDHLPTLLPREASESFCEQLMPSLLELQHVSDDGKYTRVW